MSEETDRVDGVERICEICFNPITPKTAMSWRATASQPGIHDYSYYHTRCLMEAEAEAS